MGPQDLKIIGKLHLPFEIQNLNTVQLYKKYKKYRGEVSLRYGSVVFLVKVWNSYSVKHLQVASSKFGLLIPTILDKTVETK